MKEIRRSLATRDPVQAKSLAYALSFAYLKAFGKMSRFDDNKFLDVSDMLSFMGGVGKIIIKHPSGMSAECDTIDEFKAIQSLFESAPSVSSKTVVEPVKSSSVRFSSASASALLDASGKWADRTLSEYRAKSKYFEDYIGDKCLDEITRADLTSFKRKFQETKSAGRTINKHLSVVSLVYDYAIKNGLYNGVNPAVNQSVSEKKLEEVRSPFLPPHFSLIASALKEKEDFVLSMFCYIAFYTGMRVGEIGQLRCVDIYEVDVDGKKVPCISNNLLHADKRLKTKESIRLIPIHKKLIDYGFLDYVDSIRAKDFNSHIFPGLGLTAQGYGKDVSKRFSSLLIKLGIKESTLSFHSFRHTLNHVFIDSHVDHPVRCAWMGHKFSSVNTDDYGKKVPLSTLVKVCFPVLDSLNFGD